MSRFALFASAFAFAASVHAQTFPQPGKPVRIVVPFPPGGQTDIQARAIAQKMGATLGAAVIVENKPGASTVIGAREVQKAAPDGHTLLYTIATHVPYKGSGDALAGLPTMREQGFDVGMWSYLWFWGPAGMPSATVDTLYRHLAFAIKHPDTVKLFADGGSEASGMTPAEMAKEVRRLDAGWSAIIREVGIKLDQ